jgi:PAS domain S-box-containing protein
VKEALFRRQLAVLRKQFDTMVRRAGKPARAKQGLVDEALEELSSSLEELQVADEELRQQNEELQEARAATEEQRRRYQDLFEFAPDGYVVMDPRGIIQEANQAAAAMLGVRSSFLIGKPLSVYLAEEERRAFRSHLDRMVRGQGGPTQAWDSRLKPRRGAPIAAVISLAAASRKNGKVAAVRCLIQDITWRWESKEMQRLNVVDLQAQVATRTAELAQFNKDLAAEVVERRRLAIEVVRVSEAERQRIGQDLHDSLGQNLTGLAFMSANLQRDLASKNLAAAKQAAFITKRLNETVAATRALARGLCPVVLKPEELCASLQRLAADTTVMFHVKCQANCPVAVTPADHAAAIHLYRIAQEAINNAVKHSQAKRITLTLTARKKSVQLVVDDDGVGLPKQRDKAKGLGLHIMSYRAKTIGGDVEVRKRPGGGTRIICTLAPVGK